MPGGTPSSPSVSQMLSVAPAMVVAKTRGLYPAPKAIMAAMVEGAYVDFDTAQLVAGWITPVPGGVGPMTIACLLANTVTTASLISGIEPPKDLTP